MAVDKEPLSQARFEFKSDNLSSDLLVESISGIKMSIPVTNAEGAFGVAAKSKVNRQAAPSAVESQEVTVTFVTSSKAPKAVADWFYESHSTPDLGGATKTKGKTEEATITVFKQDGSESASWTFKGVMPKTYNMSGLDAAGNEALKETVTFAYEYVKRTK
ncbi:phage tail protein [Phormidium sp. CCY1219]|uniref:phage tail protein n=1 Tax=Phormidium sp. CCY1219 TaxID=2886104 RepID=UPI002D1EF4BA|nr:phage tail protein [Phormidium sp. CCY1219]MEB3828417.1 phage tail protein [Phormidium sp. CCY1219]